jgi:hypothetical protein
MASVQEARAHAISTKKAAMEMPPFVVHGPDKEATAEDNIDVQRAYDTNRMRLSILFFA